MLLDFFCDFIKWRGLSVLLLVGCNIEASRAYELDITAVFRIDSANPNFRSFKNTTPNSGWCTRPAGRCEGDKFTLRAPIAFHSNAPIAANHSDVRRGAMFKLPSQWRKITVYHDVTREPYILEVRISGIASKYTLTNVRHLIGDPSVPTREAHERLWGGTSWWIPPSPCYTGGAPSFAATDWVFVWDVGSGGGVCAKKPAYNIPWMNYETLDITYELRTPNPLSMRSGQYRGLVDYTVGPGGDFDMGDVMEPTDSSLVLNFLLDVEHALKIDIPPGGNRVELVPEGGWQSWLQNPARIPKKLFRDQTFHISASGPFGMRLICSNMDGQGCAIRNENNHVIPVAVDVSLPSGIVNSEGRPVVRQALRNDLDVKFQPGNYVDYKPATLHFEANRLIDEMLREHAGSTYSGTITVVWDSDV